MYFNVVLQQFIDIVDMGKFVSFKYQVSSGCHVQKKLFKSVDFFHQVIQKNRKAVIFETR